MEQTIAEQAQIIADMQWLIANLTNRVAALEG